nr:hypothetical protein [Lysobacter enzymogenes]
MRHDIIFDQFERRLHELPPLIALMCNVFSVEEGGAGGVRDAYLRVVKFW